MAGLGACTAITILCAVHELVEAVLCDHWEHFTAETIERQLAIALRRDWRDYMAACNKLFE